MTDLSARLFHPFRVLGLVTDDTPMFLDRRGKETFLLVSVGHAFHTYDVKALHLKIVSTPTPTKINAITGNLRNVFTALGSEVWVWSRARHVGTFVTDGEGGKVTHLSFLGKFLIATTEFGKMYLFDTNCRFPSPGVVVEPPRFSPESVNSTNSSKSDSNSDSNSDPDSSDSSGSSDDDEGKSKNSDADSDSSDSSDSDSSDSSESESGSESEGAEIPKEGDISEESKLYAHVTMQGTEMSEDNEAIRVFGAIGGSCTVDLGSGFTPVAVVHPQTYLNKVVVASKEGELKLVNLKSRKVIFSMPGWPVEAAKASGAKSVLAALAGKKDRTAQFKRAAITCVAQSNAVDVVGVGLEDGRTLIYHLRKNKVLMQFAAGERDGAVVGLSFRSDGPPTVAVSLSSGRVAIWGLSTRRLLSTLVVHPGPASTCQFVLGEPLLVTASRSDNSVRIWIFDSAEGNPRQLRHRQGHSAPPSVLEWVGAGGTTLLSAGADRSMRMCSIFKDSFNHELSQGKIRLSARKKNISEASLKLPAITAISASNTNARRWDNIVTVHTGLHCAQTWNSESIKKGKHQLSPEPASSARAASGAWNTTANTKVGGKNAAAGYGHEERQEQINQRALSVCVSECGNFAIMGTAAGRVEKFNIQSGRHRGIFGGNKKKQDAALAAPHLFASWSNVWKIGLTEEEIKRVKSREVASSPEDLCYHVGGVTGVAVDDNSTMAISGGVDGFLRFWDFRSLLLLEELPVAAGIDKMVLHRGSGLLAVAGDDYILRVVDIQSKRVVRRFEGHTARITALSFSADGRWILTGSSDCGIRVFDIPSSRIIDEWRTDRPCTAIALSPKESSYLVTAHAGSVGLFLWSNRALFTGVHPSPLPVDYKVPRVALPGLGSRRRGLLDEGESESESESEEEDWGLVNIQWPAWDPAMVMPPAGEIVTPSLGNAPPSKRAPPVACDDAVSLSGLPRTRWATLHKMDLIKERNTAKAAPEKPTLAPFFLPSATVAPVSARGTLNEEMAANPSAVKEAAGLASEEAADAAETAEKESERRALLGRKGGLIGGFDDNESDFERLLRAGDRLGDYTALLNHCKANLTPSSLDIAIRTLSLVDAPAMLRFFVTELGTHKNYEVLEAYLALFLNIHGQAIAAAGSTMAPLLSILKQRQRATWRRVEALLQWNACAVEDLCRISDAGERRNNVDRAHS